MPDTWVMRKELLTGKGRNKEKSHGTRRRVMEGTKEDLKKIWKMAW